MPNPEIESRDTNLTLPCSNHWTLVHNLAAPERAPASSVPDG